MLSLTLNSLVGRRILLLSPHADDVAYSIGGIVANLSLRADILLVRIFGRSGWALASNLREASVDVISAVREQEDRAYCERRRIDYSILYCPDSFVMGYDEATELSVVPDDDPRTADVVTLIGDTVARLVPDVVVAPCGLGGHVDHRIVRTAADALHQADIFYYEDIPYSASLRLYELDKELATQGLAPAGTVDIELVVRNKCEDMWSYRSQTSALTVAEMLQHAGRIGASTGRYAERVWRRTS